MKTKFSFFNISMSSSVFLLTFLSSCNAFAQSSSESPVGQGLYYIINSFVYGTDGVAIATISVAATGVAALMHKIHWGVFITVLAGVSIIFGAPAVVSGIKSLVSIN